MPVVQSIIMRSLHTMHQIGLRCLQLSLTQLAYALSHCTWPWLKNRLIIYFLSHWTPDLKEAQESNPFAYRSFNAFFTRPLAANARPQHHKPHALLAPADGTLTQLHLIEKGHLIQAKKHTYTVKALLGGHSKLSQQFQTGMSSTIYLAPTDYHRVHMPLDGTLKHMIHIPGSLYSVNTQQAESCPDLFAKNERLVCIFDTEHGAMAVVMVGALLVASIETVWHGLIRPVGFGKIQTMHYATNQAPTLKQGDLMGWFHFGSTVICLLNASAQPLIKKALPCSIQHGSILAHIEQGT